MTEFTGDWTPDEMAAVKAFLWTIGAERKWLLFLIGGLFLAKCRGWRGCLLARELDPLLGGMLREELAPTERRPIALGSWF